MAYLKIIRSLFASFFIAIICISNSNAQDIPKKGILLEQGGVKIELGVKIPKKACDPSNFKKSIFCIYVFNAKYLPGLKQYLNWKMDFVNCNGDIVEKTISVDLRGIKNEGQNLSNIWEFDGNQIEKAYYNVENSDYPDNTKDFAKAKAQSSPADSIVGNAAIILGESVTLTVKGGSLTSDAKWVWYSGSCSGGTKEGEGPSITKNNINKNTNFFVRAEGARNTTTCVSKQVVVDNNSRPADGIEGRMKICKTQVNKEILLYVVGGKKGLNAHWVWYKNNCNGFLVGTGDSIYVSPDKTITYFVRAEGPTINSTSCVSHTIEVLDPSIKPQSIEVTQPNKCANQSIILEQKDGKLSNNAHWVWRSQIENNSAPREEGQGSKITVLTDAATTYSVSAEDDVCPSTDETTVLVNVKILSQDPSGIIVQKEKRNHYKLTVDGGILGDGAKWVWYKNKCEGDRISSGESTISYKSKKGDNVIYLSGEGDCNKTSCTSTNSNEIVFEKRNTVGKHKNFWFINGGVVGQTADNFNNYIATFGCRWVYVSAKFSLEKGDQYYYDNSGLVNNPSGSSYQFNTTQFYSRSSFTGGLMFGGGVFRFYLGGGLGQYQNLKQFTLTTSTGTSTTEYAREGSLIYSGPEAEGGIFLRMGSITLMGGASSIFVNQPSTSQFIDGHLSIGLKL